MSIERTQGLVLNKRDLRETSLIVDFYTKEFGKICTILKGIRTDPKKFASNLELFSLNEIIFYRKTHSSYHLVSQADKIDNFTRVRGNIERTTTASFMMEIRKKMLEDKVVDVMIAIGTNFFYTVTLPCTLWFFDKGKRKASSNPLISQSRVIEAVAQDDLTAF